MAQVQLLCVAVLCVLALPQCSALKCYVCTECAPHELGTITKCELGQDVCMSVTLGEASMKMCASRTFCRDGAGDVEMGLTDTAKKSLVDLVKNTLDTSKEDTNPIRREMDCCQTDFCNHGRVKLYAHDINTASTLTSAAALLLMPLLVGTLFV